MEASNIQNVEYVDAICLDKSIILNDGTTTATITTVDGQSLPVTFIVSQPFEQDITVTKAVEESANAGSSVVLSDIGGTVKENDTSSSAYTIHFPTVVKQEEPRYLLDNQPIDVIPQAKPVSDHEMSEMLPSASIESTESLSRLEDFMDVVTTYKCKFCRFSCPWKSGLMSHIRCCHIKEDKTVVKPKIEKELESSTATELPKDVEQPFINSNEEPSVENSTKEDTNTASASPKMATEDENSNSSTDSPVQERHIFLCGQCSEGFASLEECKQHMVEDHSLKLTKDTVKTVRKRGRPRTRPPKEEKPKRRPKKVPVPKEKSGKRKPLYMSLEDELDSCIRRKLRTGYVNDRAFRCTKNGCGHRFTTDSNLNYHFGSHSATTEKPFVCPECREEFLNWRALAMHLWREHTIDIDLYSCPDCSYKAFSFFKVDNHRKIHSDERPYICETCNKSFKQISQLRNHVVIHLDRRNLPEKRWYSEQQCHTCGRKFSDTKCLRKHEQAVHSRLKPYVCSFCGHLSARKAMLDLHMRQHTGEKPFMCEHCDYRTGDHNSLRRHRMRHTGDKPYKCPHCPYACIQAISYKTHLRNKHPGMDGLYSCNMCTFKTVSKDNFLHHTADHKRMAETAPEPDSTVDEPVCATDPEVTFETVDDPSAVQMQLTDNALQQLEGILPGNITAAQLIYSCLNAMSQDGGGPVTLPSGVTFNLPSLGEVSGGDGTQTITIQVPSGDDAEPFYFTIQQQDGNSSVIIPDDVQITDQDNMGESAETMEFVESVNDQSTQTTKVSQMVEDGQLC
ncbi:hypothetical protein JTE90_014663 [Oedothorax gibbosus]|uniref:C2H2-type domain-containing protein n=1 Tax=Oedothorax gibbosus TaxID=931172 RepID=A0AAV6V9L8_9ARAC|nr:hypothetical protein JTE90_014663 [Oedothorax gibbosus]